MASFVMYVIPAAYWGQDSTAEPGTLRSLLQEAVALRRRVAKGANQEAERSRYSICLVDLESRLSKGTPAGGPPTPEAVESAIRSHRIAAFALDVEYFDLLAWAHLERTERQSTLEAEIAVTPGAELGSSVFPPEVLADHIQELDRLAAGLTDQHRLRGVAESRAAIFRVLEKTGAGIVEVSEEFDNEDIDPPPERRVPTKLDQLPPPSTSNSAKGRRKMAERFRSSVEAALPLGGKINLSDQPHEISTEVLAAFLFAGPNQSAGQVRIIYADGSEARPFLLRDLVPPKSPTRPSLVHMPGAVELPLALMSMRHLELDPFVERAWYRNKEISVTRPLAESDEFCFQYSLRELEELRDVYGGQPVLIRMFHTGFEPAAVGFYRAVVTELKARRGWLHVLPHYYRGGSRFETGHRVWE